MNTLNFYHGQFFCYRDDLIFVDNVSIIDDEEHSIFYHCIVLHFDKDKHNYVSYKAVVSHDFVLKNFDLIYVSNEVKGYDK